MKKYSNLKKKLNSNVRCYIFGGGVKIIEVNMLLKVNVIFRFLGGNYLAVTQVISLLKICKTVTIIKRMNLIIINVKLRG